MTRNFRTLGVLFLTALTLFTSPLLFSQQSNFQTYFLTPTAVRPINPGTSATVVESEHLPYLKELAKSPNFQPTPSDLLIQQAEERFRNGKKAFQDHDYPKARIEFDAAIDAMLGASDNPSNRTLFESKLEDMVDTIHRDDLAGMGAAAVEDVPGFDKAPLDDIVTMTFPVDPKIKDKVKTELKSTSSALPLVVNDTVLSYINYFNGRGRKTIEFGLERAGKYSAMISRILAEEAIPQELIHLAQAESGFMPRAVSRAAAEGLWQFVKFRGNEYGLKQTAYSDERLDPEKATRAAARHLHDLYNEFGDWYLAMAAYNCGPGAVEKAVERTGYADFWELRARRALPIETTNYVPIILAITIMTKNATEYGLDHINADPAVEYDTIMTSSPTNLALISDLSDTPVSELVQLNPALLRNIAPGNFEIRVPKGMGTEIAHALDVIPAEQRINARMHRVAPGETLAAIARQYNASTTGQIIAVNNLGEGEPAEGDRLIVPAAYHEPANSVRTPRLTAHRAPTHRSGAVATAQKAPARTVSVAAKHSTAPAIAQVSHTRSLNR